VPPTGTAIPPGISRYDLGAACSIPCASNPAGPPLSPSGPSELPGEIRQAALRKRPHVRAPLFLGGAAIEFDRPRSVARGWGRGTNDPNPGTLPETFKVFLLLLFNVFSS
jgi:hypothetical protein